MDILPGGIGIPGAAYLLPSNGFFLGGGGPSNRKKQQKNM